MRWEGREESSNIEDRRGMAMAAGSAAFGGGGFMIIAVIILTILGGNPMQLIEQAGETSATPVRSAPSYNPADDRDAPLKSFVAVVMKDTEDVWGKLFKERLGARYQEPKLVLFTGSVRSACGGATAASGPFYCPGDDNVYLDFEFFRVLKNKLGSPGDFAMAYVIAHEVGHHVQNQLGLSAKVQKAQRTLSKEEGNQLSVRLELQADYLAGVWAHHAQQSKKILEQGDREEALNAAMNIGDDVLQYKATGRVRKDEFTHGSSASRAFWFNEGFKTGDVEGMMKLFELPFEKLEPK